LELQPLKTPTNPEQGWFIFTFILVICTLKSTVAFFLLFFFLDLTFLLLALAYLLPVGGSPNTKLLKAGGLFGFLAAFAAWYNALAGIADNSNSFFIIPVAHFPWSPTGRSRRDKTDREMA
jgi:succinate-acetate transporter protein